MVFFFNAGLKSLFTYCNTTKNTKYTFLLLFFLGAMQVFSQVISATNVSSNCNDCAPSGWIDNGGTPDVSNKEKAATFGVGGGGSEWVASLGGTNIQLPLPPNGHENWLSLRDLGPTGVEESVRTMINGLTVNRDYEVIVYSLTAVTDKTGTNLDYYSGTYIDKFTFTVAGANKEINTISKNSWGISRLTFNASSANQTLTFFPGNNGAGRSAPGGRRNYETVQLSITVDAINTVPFADDNSATTTVNKPVVFNVVSTDIDYDTVVNTATKRNGSIDNSSVDLNLTTAGIQNSIVVPLQGSWNVDSIGNITFQPLPTFLGTASINYTVRDNYRIDGLGVSATSNQATLSVVVSAIPILAVNDNATGVNGVVGATAILNVYTGDILDGISVNASNVNLTEITAEPNAYLRLRTDGTIDVLPNTPSGIYSLTYGICEKINPTNCATAVVSVTVEDCLSFSTNDCDKDGNPNSSDPHPSVATALNDTFGAAFGLATSFNILQNDDYVLGANTSITRAGGTATGVVVFTANNGQISYTPTSEEAVMGGSVTVNYQVCNTAVNPDICSTATITINITDKDTDGDGVPDGKEISDNTNPNDVCSYKVLSQVLANVTAVWNNADCDKDGVINSTEIADTTDVTNPCSMIKMHQTVSPDAIWNTSDCDTDGNPNATDSHVLVATALNDTFGAAFGQATSFNILQNDDYLAGDNTSITRTGGTANGVVVFTANNGEISYTPTSEEAVLGGSVTVNYQVCNTAVNPDVCSTATITINITDKDTDGDGVPDGKEISDNTNANDVCSYKESSQVLINVTSTWNNADCDNDGVINKTEATNDTNIFDACSYKITDVTLPITSGLDCDGDGVLNVIEIANSTNPNEFCSYNVVDITEEVTKLIDCDGDGVLDILEIVNNTDPHDLCSLAISSQTVSSSEVWNTTDCDGDSITNLQELIDQTDLFSDCSHINGIAKDISDCDADGLTKGEEISLGTDPNNPDTDGDGVLDWYRILRWYKPTRVLRFNTNTPNSCS